MSVEDELKGGPLIYDPAQVKMEIDKLAQQFFASGRTKVVEFFDTERDAWVSGGLNPDFAYDKLWRLLDKPRPIPLGKCDIKFHHQFKLYSNAGGDSDECISVPNAITGKGIFLTFSSAFFYTYEGLQRDALRSTDGGETWHRCEKEPVR